MGKAQGKRFKTIPLKSKLLREELVYARGWTKHHTMQESPLDGEPAVSLGPSDSMQKVYYDLIHKKYVIKALGGVWYELEEERLNELRRERK